MKIGTDVKLNVDLTDYHPSLVVGVIGKVVDYSRLADRFALVRFPETTLDVLWSGLDYANPEDEKRAEAEAQAHEAKEKAAIQQTCNKAVWYQGPRGGFKYLSINYTMDGTGYHVNSGNRSWADKVAMWLRDVGIKISYKTI